MDRGIIYGLGETWDSTCVLPVGFHFVRENQLLQIVIYSESSIMHKLEKGNLFRERRLFVGEGRSFV